MARYGLPCPGGANAEGNIPGLHPEQIGLLPIGFWNDGRLARRGLNAQIQKTAQIGAAAVLAGSMHGIVEFRSPDDHSPFARFVELLENLARPANRILVSLDPQPTVPGRYPDIERGFELAEKLAHRHRRAPARRGRWQTRASAFPDYR